MEKRKKRSAFDKLSAFFLKMLQRSFIGKFFTSYDKANSRFQKITQKSKNRHSHRKNAFVRVLENNIFARIIPKIVHALLRVSVRNYAVLIFTMGLVILPQYFLNNAGQSVLGYAIPGSLTTLILSISLMVVSFPFVFYGRSLSQALLTVKLFSFIAFKLFGVDSEGIVNASTKKRASKTSIALILGGALGVASYFVNPFIFLYVALAILFAYNAFRTPENGVILVILALPFAPSLLIKIAILYVSICYLIKIILKKRVCSFEYLDAWVTVAILVTLVCGIDYQNLRNSIPVVISHFVIMASYFLFANLIRSRTWFRKCIFALTTSALIASIIGIVQFTLGSLSGVNELSEALSEFAQFKYSVNSVFGSSDTFAQYLIIAIPFGLVHLLSDKKTSKFGNFLISVILITALVFTNSQYAYIGFIISLLFLLIIYNRNNIYLALAVIAGTIGVYFLFSKVDALRSFADSLHIFEGFDISEKLSELGAGFNAIWGLPEIFGTGIGGADVSFDSLLIQLVLEHGIITLIAIGVFAAMFSRMIFSHCNEAKKRSRRMEAATGLCALFGLAVTGVFKNVWADDKIMLLCVILIALSVAYVKREKSSEYVADLHSDLTKASLDIELDEEDLHEYSSRRKYVHAPKNMKGLNRRKKIKILPDSTEIIRIKKLDEAEPTKKKKKKKKDIYDDEDASEENY